VSSPFKPALDYSSSSSLSSSSSSDSALALALALAGLGGQQGDDLGLLFDREGPAEAFALGFLHLAAQLDAGALRLDAQLGADLGQGDGGRGFDGGGFGHGVLQ